VCKTYRLNQGTTWRTISASKRSTGSNILSLNYHLAGPSWIIRRAAWALFGHDLGLSKLCARLRAFLCFDARSGVDPRGRGITNVANAFAYVVDFQMRLELRLDRIMEAITICSSKLEKIHRWSQCSGAENMRSGNIDTDDRLMRPTPAAKSPPPHDSAVFIGQHRWKVLTSYMYNYIPIHNNTPFLRPD
jgi:hypothetical protein